MKYLNKLNQLNTLQTLGRNVCEMLILKEKYFNMKHFTRHISDFKHYMYTM